ncbi:YbbR domain-containing protein [Terribacillus halophilus]|uniref:YbbR domain-containing protein n=1 Tax=Terribacillus halophilus TaxID=361279 RepID=A0A1G6T561_9BACI|nr:CdaR family protein [Terribacillus halophilus]SDD24169.1 YbbR domain-containing protein [Terribacillus halophilus]
MDKWLKSPWTLRVLSLVFAVLLYAYVSAESDVNNRAGEVPITSSDETNTVDAPVSIRIDDSKYVVSGVPEYVSMQLVGSASDVTAAIQQKNYEAYVDLTDLGTGTHTVKLHYENVSDNLQVYMQPASVEVTIQEKASQQFNVNVGYTNEDQMAAGFQVDSSTVEPQTVSIVSTQEVIDQIASVRAYVDLTDVDADINSKEAPVKVYDAQGNELSVNVQPETVEISVQVSNPSKTVPVEVKTKGQAPDNASVASLSAGTKEVTIYAPQDTLDGIDSISTEEIDLSKITENQTIDADLQLPENVRSASKEQVEVDIELEETSETTIENVPITIENLSSRLEAAFSDPQNEQIDVTVSGAKSEIESLSADDITATIDGSGLEQGEQTVPIEVTGPENIELTPGQEEATITVQTTQDETNEEAGTNTDTQTQ